MRCRYVEFGRGWYQYLHMILALTHTHTLFLLKKKQSNINNNNTGTSLWMAPELVETIQLEKEGTYEASYSQAVDIYAFGIILNEVLTLSRPWSRTKYTWSHEIYEAVMKGERPVATPDEKSQAPFGFVRLMELAYHQDVKNRPPFSDITQALNEMRIQHHHSKHGSLSSSQRFSSRTWCSISHFFMFQLCLSNWKNIIRISH